MGTKRIIRRPGGHAPVGRRRRRAWGRAIARRDRRFSGTGRRFSGTGRRRLRYANARRQWSTGAHPFHPGIPLPWHATDVAPVQAVALRPFRYGW